MKKSFNPESLIIPVFVLLIVAFIGFLALSPVKPESQNPAKFVGVDATGTMHYPDGQTEISSIKF